IDECSEGNFSCDPNATCINSQGSYNCQCKNGFQGNGKQNCTDIDECSEESTNECHLNATCSNTPGSYECECRTGYHGLGRACTDIDECSDGNFTCHPNATCINTQGSYECQCKNGFQGNGKQNCTDIDECSEESTNECHLNATCSNIPGSYECECRAGYRGHGRACTDIDECSDGNFTCHPNATCINTQGSYNCQYIDECSEESTNECHLNATCSNTQGSYLCECRTGYHGLGRACTGLECYNCAHQPYDIRLRTLHDRRPTIKKTYKIREIHHSVDDSGKQNKSNYIRELKNILINTSSTLDL
ncbi:fibrillin-2-like, partial, partial [Paramuricea clavata]